MRGAGLFYLSALTPTVWRVTTTPPTPHPWRTLRGMPVDVAWVGLPCGVHAVTDGRTHVWMDRTLTQRERRCAIMHEIVHIERGHAEHQPPAVETSVRRETARRLLPHLGVVADALAWSLTLDEAADELWVTLPVLLDRLTDLDDAERRIIASRLT